MKVKPLDTPALSKAPDSSSGDPWQALSNRLNSPDLGAGEATPDGRDDDESESPRLDNDRNLSHAQLADSVAENVTTCQDCGKPVLQASMSDHQANCPSSKNLKRKLSQDSTSQQPPKKSKITLHFNNNGNAGGSPDPASTTTSAKPSPSPHPVPAAASGSTPLSISVSSNGGPSAAGLDKKNKRVVDPDRQCGVINERGLPCQRSLTCKTHNMTAKRAVPHRSQPFDSLLLEWQKASRLGKEREALSKNLREGNAIAAAANLVGPAGLGQAHGGVGMNGYDEQGGVAVPGSGKKDKKKKNANQNQPFAANGVPMFDGSSAMSPLQTNGNMLLPPNGAAPATASTTAKKSKKPSNNASGSSAAANGQMVYYVGEAPPRATTATRNGAAADDEEEEESDYLSSSDEVESVLLSIQKLTNRTATDSPIMTASPLVMREGGGSGFSSASWFTGRNRKLLRLRELGLDTVFAAGAKGGGAGGGVAGVKGAKR